MDAAARGEAETIDLSTPLSLASSFRFPLQSRIARREILIGALWLLVPGVGWVLNMGHRIVLVHNMMRGGPAWPAWIDNRFRGGRLFTLFHVAGCRGDRALRRCVQGGAGYWHAWAIALTALAVSFLGLLVFGVGFLVTSVWFWQVAGFSFATVFARRFRLRNDSGIG